MTLRTLLRIDRTAGVAVGVGVLARSRWFADRLGLPPATVVGMGVANLVYGTASGLLARQRVPSRRGVALLAGANAAWAVACAALLVRHRAAATDWGVAHLAGEGAFVATLAALEIRALRRGA